MADKRVDEHLFVWRIENFSACCNRQDFALTSPTMRAKNLDDTLWSVELIPVSKGCNNNLCVYLQRASEDDGPIYMTLEYECCVIDVFGKKLLQRRLLVPDFANENKVSAKVNRDWIRERKEFLLPNDTLTLEWRVSKHGGRSHKAYRSVTRSRIGVERSAFLWTIQGSTRKASAIKRVVHVKCKTLPTSFELACEYGDSFEEQQQQQQQKTPEGGCALRLAITPKEALEVRTFMSVTIRVLGSPRDKIEADHFFEDGSNDAWHLPSLDISDKVDGLQDGDQLDLKCEFAISDGVDATQTEETSMVFAEPSWEGNTLQHQIRSLYQTHMNSDILVETDDRSESFYAHKMILSARSLVLRRVLDDYNTRKHCCNGYDSDLLAGFNWRSFEVVNHGCRIIISTCRGLDSVMISSLPADVLELMLKCMYTDDLDPRGVSNAQQLYEAGVTFEFKLLQEKSLNYLKSHFNIKEIYSTLIFADTHGFFQLKSDSVNFILKNGDYLLASKEWLRFREDHKRLSNQVLDALRNEDDISLMGLNS